MFRARLAAAHLSGIHGRWNIEARRSEGIRVRMYRGEAYRVKWSPYPVLSTTIVPIRIHNMATASAQLAAFKVPAIDNESLVRKTYVCD